MTHIALFKNGLGYCTSTTTLPAGETTIELGRLPAPVHGTFWVGYPKNVPVRSLIASEVDIEEATPVWSVADLLAAAVGRRVKVYGVGDPIEGTAVRIGRPETLAPPNRYAMGRLNSAVSRRSRGSGAVLVLKTDAGVAVMDIGAIQRVDVLDGDAPATTVRKTKSHGLRLELAKPAGGTPVTVSYLAHGITWAPSYSIDITNPDSAVLTAKAVVLDEMVDLDEVEVDLVTGFPHARFAEIRSPLAMTQSLAEFMNALSARPGQGRQSGPMTQQRVFSNEMRFYEPPAAVQPGYSTAAAGTEAGDLFFYPVGKITLRRGETASLPLFTAEVPYEHVYTWHVPNYVDENQRYRSNRERDRQPDQQEVWHACRLTNNMKLPWTTAPAQFVEDGRFIGQDMCGYTAPGAPATVRITRAMRVLADEAEVEVKRERNAAVFFGSHHDRVTVRGELKLRNTLEEKVTLEVTKELSGETVESVPAAQDTATARGLRTVNPNHVLKWTVDLDPGEATTLTYTYAVYLRS